MRLRFLHPRLAAVAAASALALAAVPAASAQAGCASTSAMPGQVSASALTGATLCLLNAERRQRRLPPLRLNGRLSRAASVHSADMVRRDYFSHESLSGASFVDRIRRTGYLSGPRAWLVGENLAWGSGDRASAAAIVRAWMGSPGHRSNILQRRFREIGIGVMMGAPQRPSGPAATYATEFGTRG